MVSTADDRYLDLILSPIRVCARYKPKFGQKAGLAGLSLIEFQTLYRGDPFYSWFGLDNALMYAAHKAAGGMTSIYRQIGIGCEKMFRAVIQDTLRLSAADVIWSYRIPTAKAGKSRKLSLDGRIPIASVSDAAARLRIQEWMLASAAQLAVNQNIAEVLNGIVFEVRQGYKSKDSKRQQADIANAAVAYSKAYLPCAVILSAQIDGDILDRYRREQWTVLTGRMGLNDPRVSTYDFMREVVGYDLAAFFARHAQTLRAELDTVLKNLLSP